MHPIVLLPLLNQSCQQSARQDMLRVIWSFAHVMQSEMPIVLRVDEMLPFLMGFQTA